MRVVYEKNYPPPKVNEREILRYAGVKGDLPELSVLMRECLKEAETALSFKVCYAKFPLKKEADGIDLGFCKTSSKSLAVNLQNCSSFILFAATLGVGMDRLIAKYNLLSPTKALLFQAIGAERIESLCDEFNKEITEKYKNTRPRFSAGYGDFPLEAQREIFSALGCAKKIGVTLNESLLMSPSKSVTGIIGIADCEQNTRVGCQRCEKIDCEFRREETC